VSAWTIPILTPVPPTSIPKYSAAAISLIY
jgi:hypothetical protein